MTVLDAIDSHGNLAVRSARKAGITSIQGHLKYLDGRVAQSWQIEQDKQASINALISSIYELLDSFRAAIAPFHNGLPAIVFPDLDHPLSVDPPPLLFSLNKVFITHRQNIEQILDRLDALGTGDFDVVRSAKKTAVEEVLGYLKTLDQFVTNAWQIFSRPSFEKDNILRAINGLVLDLRERNNRFDNQRPLLFLQKYPSPLPLEPPPLPVHLNEVFLLHQDAVKRILRDLEDLPSLDQDVDEKKTTAINEASAYLDATNARVKDVWTAFVEEKKTSGASDTPIREGETIDCEEHFSSLAYPVMLPTSSSFP
ncbi:hypothetical protein NLJ89_g11829 [Agrocybe chaxingu]|uniref:BAG domain-containing protein n=1 Tax=Agrocybe chaxingu TaxID=84603 RepID=A0A9W8MR93_9AGAR|nr:hypothetical protein NLJ89_g11829 [Agrocybe chaxingu]